jgi:hypothetical protein
MCSSFFCASFGRRNFAPAKFYNRDARKTQADFHANCTKFHENSFLASGDVTCESTDRKTNKYGQNKTGNFSTSNNQYFGGGGGRIGSKTQHVFYDE